MQGRFESNTEIFLIVRVKYLQVLKYSNSANNMSNYSHYWMFYVSIASNYLHDFMWVMWVITHIISWYLHDSNFKIFWVK